jgi:aminocarboxymuconate-semialdehyde decarboxylase
MTNVWNKYGPTAARMHGKPGRETRPQSTTIDIHSHVAIPQAGAFVQQYASMLSPGLHEFQSPETAAVNAKQDADMKTRLTNFDERLKDLDAMGVDMQVIKPPPGQCYYTLPVTAAVKAAQIVNDGLAEFVGRRPDRLIGLGTVPLNDGAEAAKELERAVKTLGFKGVQILTNVGGNEISEPACAPFWKKAEELGVLVVIHPNGFTHGERFRRYYFNNVIGNPLETTIALHNLIFDGVLERHPDLKILAVHGGGYLGGYWGRIDHVWGARADAHSIPKPPTHYLKKIYFDTVVFSHKQLATLVETYGADHVVMGTDYPFDMADYDPVGHVASVESFDAATIAAVAGGTAKTLLGLK